MSLQGTFDTLSVTELFGLLSMAGKTGALRLEAGDLDGSEHQAGAHKATVFVAGGLCCAIESDDAGGSPGSDAELAGRLVEVGFSLARCRSGSFRFSDDERPPFDVSATAALQPAVAEIESLLDQWREIETTIPSLDARVSLAPVLRADEIVVSAREWRMLVALEGMPSVRELVARQRQPMIEVCRDLKDLVERGAIEVRADLGLQRGRHESEAATADPTGHIELLEPYAPVTADDDAIAAAEAAEAYTAEAADVIAAGRSTRSRRSVPDVFAAGADEASPEAEAADADAETASSAREPADVPQDRGALLRLFSGLKDG